MTAERVIVGRDSDFIYYEDGTHSFIGQRSESELQAERNYYYPLGYPNEQKEVVEQNSPSGTLNSTTFFNNDAPSRINENPVNAPLENLGEDKNNSSAILPGYGNYIFEYMNAVAHRELKSASIMTTLQTLSAISPKIKGYGKVPLGLVTFTVCESGAGKEMPQKIYDDIVIETGMAAAGKFTSTKTIYMDIYHGKHRAAFLSDEVHELLASMSSKRSEHMNGSEGALMTITESDKAKLTSTHRNEIIKLINEEIKGYKSQLAKLEQGINEDGHVIRDDKKKSIISAIDKKIELAKDEVKKIRETSYFDNVRLGFFGSTTPIEMAPHINKRILQNGFLARCVFAYTDYVEKSKIPEENEIDFMAIKRYAKWISERVGEITATPEAEEFLEDKRKEYDLDEYRLNKEYGALYRRMSAKINKVASLLAVGNHDLKITLAQAKAAFKIVNDSFEQLKKLCDEGESTSEIVDFEDALELRIYKEINKYNGDWCTLGNLNDSAFKPRSIRAKLRLFKISTTSFLSSLQGKGYLESVSGARGGKCFKLTQKGRDRGDELLKIAGE